MYYKSDTFPLCVYRDVKDSACPQVRMRQKVHESPNSSLDRAARRRSNLIDYVSKPSVSVPPPEIAIPQARLRQHKPSRGQSHKHTHTHTPDQLTYNISL